MAQQYVSREKAYELKKLGFNEPCTAYYRRIVFTDEFVFYTDKKQSFENKPLNNGKHDYATAPTLEEVEAWEEANSFILFV